MTIKDLKKNILLEYKNFLPKDYILHYLIINNDYKSLKYLLDNEPTQDINQIINGYAPIHLAIIYKKNDIINLLLNQENINTSLRAINKYSLYELAIISNSYDMIDILILFNININERNIAGETPLFLAIYRKKTNMIKYLLMQEVDINITNIYGHSPLFLLKRWMPNIFKDLIEDIENYEKEYPENSYFTNKELYDNIKKMYHIEIDWSLYKLKKIK